MISTNSIASFCYSFYSKSAKKLSSRYSKILYNTHTHINIPLLFTSIARSPAWATVTAASLPMCFTSRLTARDITDWASTNGNVIIPITHTPKMQLPKDYKHNKHINKYQHKATVRMWTTSAFLQFSCVEILTSNNLLHACLCVGVVTIMHAACTACHNMRAFAVFVTTHIICFVITLEIPKVCVMCWFSN